MKIPSDVRKKSDQLSKKVKQIESQIEPKYQKEIEVLDERILSLCEKLRRARDLRDERTAPKYHSELASAYNSKFFLRNHLRAPLEKEQLELLGTNEPYVNDWCSQLMSEHRGLDRSRKFEIVDKVKKQPLLSSLDDDATFYTLRVNFSDINEVQREILETIGKIRKSADWLGLSELEKIYTDTMNSIKESYPLTDKIEVSASSFADLQELLEQPTFKGPEVSLQTALLTADMKKHLDWYESKSEGKGNKQAGFRY